MLPPLTRLRTFLGDWILPPKVFERVIQFRIQQVQKNTHTDTWRYWKGTPLPALSANIPLFLEAGVAARTLTLGRESRCAATLAPAQEIKLTISVSQETPFRFGFGHSGKARMGEAAEVTVNDEPAARLECILPHAWHDVRVVLKPGRNLVIVRNRLKGPLHVSHPVKEERFPANGVERPRNIVFILLDSLVKDCIGLYGTGTSSSPCIDRYFSKGLIFENAFSQSEWTYPSLYSMFSGKYPMGHDSNDPNGPGGGFPEQGCRSLAEEMRTLGFVTFGYSSHKVFGPAYNAHLGFDRFFLSPHWASGPSHQQISRQAVIQLEDNREGRNFLFLHYLEAHEPWLTRTEMSDIGLSNFRVTDPEKEYESLKKGEGETKGEPLFDAKDMETLTRRRQARIREVDLSLGELFTYLETTGQSQDTAVVLLSDHGYNYLRQDQPLLCDSRVHVPLLMTGPGVPAGRYEGLVANNVDLMPTLLHFAGGQMPEPRDGAVVAPLGGPEREFVLSESLYGKTYQIALRDADTVYHFRCGFDNKRTRILRGEDVRKKLFARADEKSCRDISEEQPPKLARMNQLLDAHLAKFTHRIVK